MIGNALRIGLQEIRRNLLRSFLTILGIVIGVVILFLIFNRVIKNTKNQGKN